jgi:CDP-glycerol glycerophosphotransferase
VALRLYAALMPLLSFVLAAHREQAYLEGCARSVLDSEYPSLELVALDDASPDHVPELLDALAAEDGRVRVTHLPERIGRGPARNRALAAAAGDYVWFLNTTDRLHAGAVTAAAGLLEEQRPDVLLMAHTRTDSLERTKPGARTKLIERLAGEPPRPLDELPDLGAAAPPAWNKVFRRGLLEEHGIAFGDVGHSDLSVSWAALAAAERTAFAPQALLDRRAPPNAVREPSAPGDVFSRWDEVFSAAGDTLPEARRAILVRAMVQQELGLLAKLPEGERRAFFAQMSAAYRRHRGGSRPAPPGRAGRLRTRLVERDAYRTFRLLERRPHRRKKEQPKKPPSETGRRYAALREQPIDPDLGVFAAYWYRGYLDNPRAIYEKARELVPGFRGVWVVNEENAARMPPDVEHVLAGSPEYYEAIARARYFVNNVNFPNHLVKRDGTVHVMTHHGTPLKRMGLDLQDAQKAGKQTDFAALLRRCARWDFSVSSNTLSTLTWERVYPTRYETLEVGYPRNDRLALAGGDEVAEIRARLGIEPGRRAVLYAPTHRDYLAEDEPVLDLAAFADGLGPDFVILARLHYFFGSTPLLQELHRSGHIIDVASHDSVEELCLAADALVTDYSSIMFDYAILDRPIVIHAPDWDEYRTRRGTYFDLMAEPPGAVATTQPALIEAFTSGEAFGEAAAQRRAEFRARFCNLDDGGASERVVRRVWLGESA